MAGFAGTASASWSDDFIGEAEQDWTVVDLGDDSTYVVQNDRYELHTESTGGSAKSLVSFVEGSSAGQIIEGRVKQMEPGDNFLTYLLMRANLAAGNGYAFGASSDGQHAWFGKLSAGSYGSLAPTYTEPVNFDPSDFKFKSAIVDGRLMAKVWNSSGNEPDHWQVKAEDSSYSSGSGGIMVATYPLLAWHNVQAAFDYVSFTSISQSHVWVNAAWEGSSNDIEVEPGKIFGYNAYSSVESAATEMEDGGTMEVVGESGTTASFGSVHYAAHPLDSSNFITGSSFISLNSTDAPEFNTSARVTMWVPACPAEVIVMEGFPQSREEVLQNGHVCTECTVVSCNGNTIVFDVPHFSGYTIKFISTGKYMPSTHANYTTEGGNVTNIDLRSNISTEKWAGLWGNVTGRLVLAPNETDMFYTWAWNSTHGGEVCAIAAASGFDWANVQLAPAGAIDTVWGFAIGDTDSSTNTMNETCAIDVAGTAIPSTACTSEVEGGLESVVVQDGAPAFGEKDGLAFCVNITAGTSLWAIETADYTLIVPTEELPDTYETYHFWLELN